MDDESVIFPEELKAFKEAYCGAHGGKYNLEVSVPYLEKLANGYLEKYKASDDWTDILKAHALYNSVSVRASQENAEFWKEKAFEAQSLYWKEDRAWSYEVQKDITCKLANTLSCIRKEIKWQVDQVDKLVIKLDKQKLTNFEFTDTFITDIERISLSCTEQMVEFAKMVFEYSVISLISQPLCSFCVVALGSLAKGEATPYSDIEYLFLIEITTPDNINYFERLALSSYFIIGNLAETPLGYLSVLELRRWFEDAQMSGFKIDGLKKDAGSIPTGNGTDVQKNHFIATPSQLLESYERVLNDPKDEDSIKGDLTAKLQYTRLVYSHGKNAKELFRQLVERKNKLQPRNVKRHSANRNMFISDAKKFGFQPTEELINNGFSINTKKELYRYPSILLYNLSIIFSCSSFDSWTTLNILFQQQLISSSVHKSLQFLLSCACYLRLSTYLFYNSADNKLSVLPKNYFPSRIDQPAIRGDVSSGQRWFLSQTLFNLHCDYSVPLKRHVGSCAVDDIEQMIKREIENPNWLVKFQVFHCCNRWSKGNDYFEKHIGSKSLLTNPEGVIHEIQETVHGGFSEVWNSVKALTYSMCEERKYKEALEYHLAIQSMIEDGHGSEDFQEQQLIMADSKAEAADCYYGLINYKKAVEEYTSSLEIRQKHLKSNHELLAKTEFCTGRVYNMLYQYVEARGHLFKALEICHLLASREIEYNYYGEIVYSDEDVEPLVDLLKENPEGRLKYLNNPSIILAHVLWTIGLNYFYTKYYQFAFLYFERSKEMLYEKYGSEACHRDIAHIMFALGSACIMLGLHEDTEEYIKRCLTMTAQLYAQKSKFKAAVLHYFVTKNSTTYRNILVRVFLCLPRYKVPHAQSAVAILQYGLHLVHTGKNDLANFFLNKAIEMFKNTASENKEYLNGYISNALAKLALNHWKQGNVPLAEQTYSESLSLLAKLEKISPEAAALERGEILQSMGSMYDSLQQHEKVFFYFQKAKESFLFACHDDMNHPKICETELQIKSVQRKLDTELV